jgi:PKD repeat protein
VIFVTKNRRSDEYKSNIVLYDMNTKRIFDTFPFSFDILDIKISIDKKTLLFFSKNDGVFKFNIPYKYKSLISNFDIEQDFTYSNDTVSFIDKSKGNVKSWKWDFGDSTYSTSKNPKHVYLKTGVYLVKLIVSDGVYFDTLILQKNIFVRIQAEMLRNYYLDKIEGEAPFRVQFYDNSKGDIKSYKWYFGDGDYSLTRDPIHIYKKIGYFNVTLIVSDGKIFDTIVKKNYIKTQLPFKAMFELSDNVGLVPLEVRFNDKSIGEIKYYKWYFGDGDSSSLKNPIHLYSKVGVYDITLVVSDYLFQNELIVKNHIQVFQNLQSSFELSNNIGEAPFRVDFINKSTGEIKSNKWYFGDGASSTLSNTSHTYTKAGNFTVSLVVSDGKTSSTYTKEKFISVSDNTNVDSGTSKTETPPFSPNPVKDKLFIQISEFNEVDKIQILDIKGRKLIETELKESIEVSSLPKGIYFLKIGDKEWKFVKE